MQFISRLAAAAACSAMIAHAGAQPANSAAAAYPDKPVRWVVPFTPGASNDIIGRLVALKLGEAWNQQFIIDNRPGAGGLIGADTVAKAAPDGYTLLLSNPGPNVNSPLLNKMAPYKVDDFAPVIFFGYAPLLILANPALPVKNPKELLDYLKANAGKVSWGSSGVGSSLHIGLALFQAATKVDVTHVPYKGSGPAITDLIGGQIQFMHTTTVSAETQIKAGRVRVVGLASSKRSPLLPDVPTMEESGLKGVTVYSWQAIAAPKGLPADIKTKLHEAVVAALNDPAVKPKLLDLGFEIVANTPEQFSAFQASEFARWKQVIELGKITAD